MSSLALTPEEVYLFKEGSYVKMYEKFGAHPMQKSGIEGMHFRVWAPNAASVAVIGDFNDYTPTRDPLMLREDDSGIWEGFIPNVDALTTYKYSIVSAKDGTSQEKSDPFAFYSEVAPKSASRICDLLDYTWGDAQWIHKRKKHNAPDAPVSIYEMHVGSWRRHDDGAFYSYTELADSLVPYIKEMGFTHVEFMPLTEYPYFGSWGYQVSGYFSATSRFGSPYELMQLIDRLHQNGIGVILDWVPSHFAVDMHALVNFDGTPLYEHADKQRGFHPEWGSMIFDYGRGEVRSFLISSALFWLERYHVDGIRVDAVASMLHLDYARKETEWTPNIYGGNENLEAVAFLKKLNESVFDAFDDVMMIAEESTAWPMVTRRSEVGGLGFTFKWNMGWMHDTLKYMSLDPIYRAHHHHQLTFSLWYAFDESFMLPLSHDEVVHMKGSLMGKMPGDFETKCANLRLLYAYMFTHPGKKLLFMGSEFGVFKEWAYEGALEWELLQNPLHKGLQRVVSDLNLLYKTHPALHLYDDKHKGFLWIDNADYEGNTLSFIRKCDNPLQNLYIIANFANAPKEHFVLGVEGSGVYEEIFNSDAEIYGGKNRCNTTKLLSKKEPRHNYADSITLTLAPLSLTILRPLLANDENKGNQISTKNLKLSHNRERS